MRIGATFPTVPQYWPATPTDSLPFFGEIAGVDGDHPFGRCDQFCQHLLMGRQHGTMIPAKGLNEHLHGPDGLFVEELKRDRFRGFGLGIDHEPGKISQSQAVMFDAAVCVVKASMKVDQLVWHRLNIIGIEFQIDDQPIKGFLAASFNAAVL